jgi:fluoride exporter
MLVAVAVVLGGAAGALARYAGDRLIEHHLFTVFPWSTFAINLSGCLLAGAVVAALVDRHHAPEWLRAGLVVGFLGAYTTFSTFAQETHDLLDGGHVLLGVANAVGSVVCGVTAVVAGAALGRAL